MTENAPVLVFEGSGVIKDFPGNYTQYREWKSLKSEKDDGSSKKAKAVKKDYHHDTRRRMSFKEKREFEQLSKDIEALETEQPPQPQTPSALTARPSTPAHSSSPRVSFP